MDEGNIFEDLKLADSDKADDDTITITKSDLTDLIDNLKVQHRAEIDAIMLEQTSYKRIIQQMIFKFKDL